MSEEYKEEFNSDYFSKRLHDIAQQGDPINMAIAISKSVRDAKSQGNIFPPEYFSIYIHKIKDILYEDYEWEEEQIEIMQKKFFELNKYYFDNDQKSQILASESFRILRESLRKNGMNLEDINHNKENNLIVGFIRKPEEEATNLVKYPKNKYSMRYEYIKEIGIIIVSLTVIWLALLGLVTLLGI